MGAPSWSWVSSLPLEDIQLVVVGVPELGAPVGGPTTYPDCQILPVDLAQLLYLAPYLHGRREDLAPGVEVLLGPHLSPLGSGLCPLSVGLRGLGGALSSIRTVISAKVCWEVILG